MIPRHVLAGVALSVFLVGSGGCLVMSGKSSDEWGVRITDATLTNVVPGETTEAWLLATLGEPTERQAVEGQEGTQILKYRYSRNRSEGALVFLIFAGGSSQRESVTTFFEVVDGVVTRHWTEGETRRNPPREFGE
ncbi:MAG: hypothetical protein ACYTGC_00255 [Planctomycetota bacterium]|jgi:hypothetical protein